MVHPTLAQENVTLIRHSEGIIFVGAVSMVPLIYFFGFSAHAMFGGAIMGAVLAVVWPFLWKMNRYVLNILVMIPVLIFVNRFEGTEGYGIFLLFPSMLIVMGSLWFLNKQRLCAWLERSGKNQEPEG